MTPKQKADKLIKLFNPHTTYNSIAWGEEDYFTGLKRAKEAVLLCINEIESYRRVLETDYDEDFYHAYDTEEYWKQVKQEVNNINIP